MEKQQLKFKTTYLLGTLLVDQLHEHKKLANSPNADLVAIYNQQRLDVMDSAGPQNKLFLIHRKQLNVFALFLSDVSDYLLDSIKFLQQNLTARHSVEMIQCLLDLQELRSKTEFAKDFPEMEVD